MSSLEWHEASLIQKSATAACSGFGYKDSTLELAAKAQGDAEPTYVIQGDPAFLPAA